LEGKGYLPAVIDYALEKLKGYDFVNDGDYAQAYVEFSAKKKGGRLIRMELRKKGVDDTSIEGALETLDEQTELDTAREILEKYMRGKTADKPTLQKAFRYLLGKGFDVDVIRSVLRAFGDCEDE
jgi:regulatory protein